MGTRAPIQQVERGVIPQHNRAVADRNAFDQDTKIAELPESEGWQNSEGPRLVKLATPGDTVSGVLLKIVDEEVTDERSKEKKPVTTYFLECEGELLKLRSSASLAQKIYPSMVGLQVRIRFLGVDQSMGREGNAMKIFQVQSRHIPRQNNPKVTGSDVGF